MMKYIAPKTRFSIIIGFILLYGCHSTTADKTGQADFEKQYFSLEDYFTGQAVKLEQQAPEILKTVSNSGQSETKTLKIRNWKNELASFIQADINKPAWKGQYLVDSSSLGLVYTSTDPDLRTQKISIEKSAEGEIKRITIESRVRNALYNSEEHLSFYPDSLYEIRKQQDVKVIGKNDYIITGKIRF